jgi:hypothetical protein
MAYSSLALVTVVLLLWRLSSLPGGLSKNEVISREASADIHSLLNNPADAPYHILQHAFYSLHAGIFSLRLASVILAVVFVSGFYLYMRGLFGRLIGLLGSLILLSLPFYSIPGRQATPQIMLFAPLLLMYIFHIFNKSESKTLSWITLALASGICLYTPGLVWWLVTAAIFSHKKLLANIAKLPSLIRWFGIGVFALCVTPLIVIVSLHIHSLKQLLLIPSSWPAPLHYGAELLRMLSALVFKSPGHSSLLLKDLPVLNIALIALAAFGGYALFSAARNKAVALGLSIILSILLSALKEDVAYLALAVPALALAVTAGLRYLYVEWRGIFPRNPVPKTFALVLIAVVALAQIYYGANYCLRAWPNSPAVRSAYVLK